MDGLTIERWHPPTEVTIEVTARMLEMTELRVNELLDAGRIEFRQDNGERLVQTESLVNFFAERRQISRELKRIVVYGDSLRPNIVDGILNKLIDENFFK